VPDYFGDVIDWRWVIFPWNFTEDLCNIVAKLADKCSDTEEIRRSLKEDYDIDIEEWRLSEILEELERRSNNGIL
jgi:hypothetical protein